MKGSSRVQLEVAFLDAQRLAPAPTDSAARDEQTCQLVLVVAAESDFRHYVRECLRERTDFILIEAATVATAVALAANFSLGFLIVDEPEHSVVTALSQLRAIVIVDDVPRGAPLSATRVRLIARPFTAEGLGAEIRLLTE